jgi:hypothetical protein
VRPAAPARGVPRSPAPGDRRGAARLARCATRPVRPCWLKSCPLGSRNTVERLMPHAVAASTSE